MPLGSQYSSVPSHRKATGRKKHQYHTYISFVVNLLVAPLHSIVYILHYFFPSENFH